MPTTARDAQALTYLAKRLREETHGANRWDEAGIYATVAKLVGRNLAVTVEQVTRHAADPEAKTPGAITRPFLPEPPKSEAMRPPKAADECDHHPGQWAGNCGGCVADTGIGYDDGTPAPRPPRAWDAATEETKATALAEARAALAATKGGAE